MTGPYVQFASGGAMVRVATDSAITFNDDVAQYFGTGDTVAMLWETADGNANYLLEALPVGGATDVPVHVIGDANAINVDTGFFDGITMPTLAILNIARDAYISIDAGDDGVAAAKGIYFKAAADEDIEIINLSVTGTPRVFWDESESVISVPIGLAIAGLKITNDGTITTLLGTAGDYNRIGDAAGTSNSLASEDDLLVTGKLEVDGVTYLDGQLLNVGTVQWYGAATGLYTGRGTDGDSALFYVRDSSVDWAEIMRLVGAADPYLQIGRDDTGVATNAITDGVVFQMGAGANNEAAGQGFGMVFKLGNAASQPEERASWDTVLVTATDGSEDARFDWNLMSAGAMNLAMQLAATGVLDVDASSGLGAATVGLFDDYDDALILRQGISERKMEVLERIGVMRKKESGSGWFMNVHAMSYLLAGGIYQTRQALEDVKDELISRLQVIETELALRRN